MKWEKVVLGDVCDSCLGKMLDQKKNKGIFQPYLANVDVRWGSFDLDHLSEMRFEDNEEERYGLHYGDLVICEGGEPGRCAIWKEQIPNMKIQKALHRVRVHNDMDYRYLFYWFLLAGKTGALEQYFTGATIKHMPGQKLKSVVIDKPPIEIQHRIADILSAYDDLIENNQEQIKLLEEAAQRLYKEWFVDLHFPGWENATIVDGIPEGWKKERLIDIVGVQYGFAFNGALFNSEKKGTPIIRIRNIPSAQTDDYTTESAEERYMVHNGDILIGMDGEFHINTWGGSDGYLVQRVCSFRPHDESIKGYLLQAIVAPIKFFEKTVVGATVAHLGKKHIDSIEILTAPAEYYAPFQTWYKKRQLLMNQNVFLKEARDRLLPKLMSDELEV